MTVANALDDGRSATLIRSLAAIILATVLSACSLGGAAEISDEPRTTRESANPEVLAELDLLLASDSPPEGMPAEHWPQVRMLYGDSTSAAPLWMRDDGRPAGRARVLVDAVSSAPDHALRTSGWPVIEAAEALDRARGRGSSPEERVRADVLLAGLFVAYASDFATGRTNPRDLDIAWYIDSGNLNLDSVLVATARSDVLSEALQRLHPAEEGYPALVREHVRYREIASAGGWPRLPGSGLLEPGDTSEVVAVLKQRLAAEGYLPDEGDDEDVAPVYDSSLVAAVIRFQERHGLAVDTVVGPGTRAALDVSAVHRAAQIGANLERYRWLPANLGRRYVLVNVPEFRLQAFDSGEVALDMRVVVGEELTNTRTPAFADSMSYVQFGPYWNVPDEITKEEILPEALADPGYLERNEYEVVSSWEEDAEVIPLGNLSMSDLDPENFEYRVRQRPGPENALGRVKFMFPNSFAIYLHDTPAEHLFDERVRAFSHGCVRVEHPGRLAEFVLRGHPEWTPERIRQTLAAGERERVDLPEKIPVYLLYLTAFVRDDELQFRDDLYDRDDRLIDALGGEAALVNGAEDLEKLRSAVGLD